MSKSLENWMLVKAEHLRTPEETLGMPQVQVSELAHSAGKGLILPTGGNHVVFLELRRHPETAGPGGLPSMAWHRVGLN